MSSDCVNPLCSCGQHPETKCDPLPIEKTSRWTDAEREKSVTSDPDRIVQKPALPAWIGAFEPHSTFTVNGWECAVRHVGYEGGHWMMLVEPLREVGVFKSKGRKRAEYRRLVRTVGKKEARARTRNT